MPSNFGNKASTFGTFHSNYKYSESPALSIFTRVRIEYLCDFATNVVARLSGCDTDRRGDRPAWTEQGSLSPLLVPLSLSITVLSHTRTCTGRQSRIVLVSPLPRLFKLISIHTFSTLCFDPHTRVRILKSSFFICYAHV